jgi:hypothetical protein
MSALRSFGANDLRHQEEQRRDEARQTNIYLVLRFDNIILEITNWKLATLVCFGFFITILGKQIITLLIFLKLIFLESIPPLRSTTATKRAWCQPNTNF